MAEKAKVSPTVCAYSNEGHTRLFFEDDGRIRALVRKVARPGQ